MELPTDIRAFIESGFRPEQREEALSILGQARIEDGTVPNPRLLRCAAFASHGNLPRLQYYVSLLAIDWRDVIVAGEYEMGDKDLVQVRNLDQPFCLPP